MRLILKQKQKNLQIFCFALQFHFQSWYAGKGKKYNDLKEGLPKEEIMPQKSLITIPGMRVDNRIARSTARNPIPHSFLNKLNFCFHESDF